MLARACYVLCAIAGLALAAHAQMPDGPMGHGGSAIPPGGPLTSSSAPSAGGGGSAGFRIAPASYWPGDSVSGGTTPNLASSVVMTASGAGLSVSSDPLGAFPHCLRVSTGVGSYELDAAPAALVNGTHFTFVWWMAIRGDPPGLSSIMNKNTGGFSMYNNGATATHYIIQMGFGNTVTQLAPNTATMFLLTINLGNELLLYRDGALIANLGSIGMGTDTSILRFGQEQPTFATRGGNICFAEIATFTERFSAADALELYQWGVAGNRIMPLQ
jgi:hypothetical protein